MRRLHVTIVLLGGLIMVGSLVIATSLLSGAVSNDTTAAATVDNASDAPTETATVGERPPTVQVFGADDRETLDPFEEHPWTATASYVHVGLGETTEAMPVAVLVLNNGSSRQLPIAVRHRPSNTTLYDDRPRLAGGEGLLFVFHEPSAYTVEVTTGLGPTTVGVQPSDFDCNERTLGVAVEPDGSTAQEMTATMSYCGSN